MKVSEAVKEMSKMYLQRIIDSFTKDFPKGIDEDRAREIILRNVDELTDPDRVESALSSEESFAERLLHSLVLESLVLSPDGSANEESVAKAVIETEQRVLELAASPDALRYEDSHSVEVLRSVLEVALEDKEVTSDELRLVNRLREKLRVSERSKNVIMAQLGHFPRSGNALHSMSEIGSALNSLQRTGAVFYCNRLEQGMYVIPDEIIPTVRRVLGIELSDASYALLLSELNMGQLKSLLEANGLPTSGSKDDRIQRVIASGLKPSECLDQLSSAELYQLCKGLPGAKVSGSKQDRMDRAIDYFASLVTKQVSDEASPREVYYEYLVELAHRDRENLLANKVIKKDLDMEHAFEEGTRHLFVEILGIELMEMSGSEHPDGCLRFGRHNDLLMWDNKSQETEYTFPNSHLRQFKRYIRDSEERVSCFMVIVPDVLPVAEENAVRLKFESGSDTDVSIITAEDLRYVAEMWKGKGNSKRFNAEVFNTTGILTRPVLDQRMKLLL